ncbi:MAG: hypothetical protein DRI56_13020, partial [Chloroflexota bacterium]
MNENWKEVLNTVAGKLTAGFAFAVVMFVAVAQFGEQIPSQYQPLPYVLIGLAYVGYALREVMNARQSKSESQTPSSSARERTVEIGNDMKDSVAITGDNNHVKFIIGLNGHTNQTEELRSQITGYLAWVEEEFGKITLRGIEQSGRQVVELPLDSVYVPLQAEHSADKRDMIAAQARSENEENNTRNIDLNQVLSLGERVIITGGPGSGKTTVLKHIAWALAYAIRYDKGDVVRDKIGLEPPLPLPIYVPLSLYASYLRDPANTNEYPKTLAAFIAYYLIQSQTNLNLDKRFFADLLRDEQRVLLLLDGLDEVPNERERVIIRQDIERLVAGKKNLRVVVTSRTVAYQGRAVLGRGFYHLSVLPIGEGLIQSMVLQAYNAIYPQTPSQAKDKGDDLIKGIRRLEADRQKRLGEDTPTLVSTPLMVRMLLIVHFNNRRLPDQRADLYQKAIDAMLRPDYALDATVAEEIEKRMGGSLAMNREMLQLLAFHMHQRGEKQGRKIDEDALREILGSDPTYESFVEDLISQTRQRGTLLEEQGGLYQFIHLSFQEFLVGRYLVERLRDVEKIVAFLEDDIVLEDWWREPILLMIGYFDITSPRVGREVLTRLAGLDKEALEKVAHLALETQLASTELAAVAFQESQNQLSTLQDGLIERLRFFFKEETQKRVYFSPSILASTADSLDKFGHLPPDLYRYLPIPHPQTPFHIAKYPVTNVQYQRFLDAPDFAEERYWVNFPKFDENSQAMSDIWGVEGYKWLRESWDDDHKIYPRYWNDPRFGIARKGVPVVGVSWY